MLHYIGLIFLIFISCFLLIEKQYIGFFCLVSYIFNNYNHYESIIMTILIFVSLLIGTNIYYIMKDD